LVTLPPILPVVYSQQVIKIMQCVETMDRAVQRAAELGLAKEAKSGVIIARLR
jgi:hypothetical protein